MKKILGSFLLLWIIISVEAIEIKKIIEFSKTEVYSKSFNNTVVKGNYLYVINNRSFQIFDIDKKNLHLISDFELSGELISLSVEGNYAYVATSSDYNRLYRLDVSSVESITVTDTLYQKGSYVQFVDGENVFIHELLVGNKWKVHIYDNRSFTKKSEIDIPHEYWPFTYVKNGKATISKYESTYLYDISDTERIRLIGYSNIGKISFPNHIEIYNDSIMVISSRLSEVKLFNISNRYDWELIGRINEPFFNFRLSNNKLIGISEESMKLYYLNNLPVIKRIDELSNNGKDQNLNICVNNEEIFITTLKSDLRNYTIYYDRFKEVETKTTIGSLSSSYIYNDLLFIHSKHSGIAVWNISQVNSPIYRETLLNEKIIYNIHGDSNIIITLENSDVINNYKNVIYKIQNDGSLTVLDKLPITNGVLTYKKNVGFFSLSDNGTLRKFFMNKENKIVEDISITLPGTKGHNLRFYKDLIYAYSVDGKLTVIKIESNSFNVISQFDSYVNYITDIVFIEKYMILCNSNDSRTSCQIIDIEDENHLCWFAAIDESGKLSIDVIAKKLFLANGECTIYNLYNINENDINTISSFQNGSKATDIKYFQKNNKKYILYLEDTSVNIYEYSSN